MTESEVLLHAAAAVLLLCLGYHHPAFSGRLGRAGFALTVTGAMVPLLDLVLFNLLVNDRIAFLTHDPFFASVFYGTLSLAAAAALAAFVTGAGWAWRAFLLVLGGFLLYQALAVVTPAGAYLLAPFIPVRQALPLFPAGHPPLLAALLLALVLMEALPRWRRVFGGAAVAALVIYGVAGAGQYGYMSLAARGLAPEGATLSIEPASPWLARWLLLVEDHESYQVRRHGVDRGPIEAPETLPRWNNEVLMARLLADPTVKRFYSRIFRHPVVKLEATDLKVTLIMQEAKDQEPPVPGRTLYYEGDYDGRNRFYRVQRFD